VTATIDEVISESTTLPVCLAPWIENPYRLVTWLEMLIFSARAFVWCGRSAVHHWEQAQPFDHLGGHGQRRAESGKFTCEVSGVIPLYR
jgi:hypothetical protein